MSNVVIPSGARAESRNPSPLPQVVILSAAKNPSPLIDRSSQEQGIPPLPRFGDGSQNREHVPIRSVGRNDKRGQRGFSLIETILAIAIIGAAFVGLSMALTGTTAKSITIDRMVTASLLARDEISVVMAKPFASVATIGTTGFGGDFSTYSYAVTVDYVDPADLTTSVVGPTDYKRVQVTVTETGWTGSIVLTDLKVNI